MAGATVRIELGGLWQPCRRGGSDRLRIHLGDRSITAHLSPLPVLPLITTLVEALATILEAPERPVRVPFPCPELAHELILRRAHGQLRLSFRGGRAGRIVVHDEVIDAATMRAALTALAETLQSRLSPAPDPALRRAMGRLVRAPTRLIPIPPGAPDAPDACVTCSPQTSRVLGIGCELELLSLPAAGRLTIRVGARAITARRGRPLAVLEALLAALQLHLEGRRLPSEIPLDDQARHRLIVRSAKLGLLLRLVDGAGHPLGDPTPCRARHLGAAVRTCLRRLRRGLASITHPAIEARVEALDRRVTDQLRWARALDVGPRRLARLDRSPRTISPATCAGPSDPPEPLPISRLHHLAYRRLWRRHLPGLWTHASRSLPAGLVLAGTCGALGLNREDGAVRWRQGRWRPLTQPSPATLVLNPRGELGRLELGSGALRWRADPTLGGAFHCATEAEGIVMMGTTDRRVIALDAARGGLRWWRHTVWGGVTDLVVSAGVVHLTGEDGLLYGFRLADGALAYRQALLGELVSLTACSGSTATPQGLLVVEHGDQGGRARLLDPLRADRVWLRELRRSPVAAPICAGELVLLLLAGELLALELATGGMAWRHPLPASFGVGCLLCVEGQVLVKNAEGAVICLDRGSGASRWTLPAEIDVALLDNCPPVTCRGLLFVPGATVRVLDPRDGRVVDTIDCQDLHPSWLHAWPNGDLAVAADDSIAVYRLHGHLALLT